MINFIKRFFKPKTEVKIEEDKIEDKIEDFLTEEEKLISVGYVYLKLKRGKKIYAKNGHRVILD